MYRILETENFLGWFNSLKDLTTRIRLARRLDRARLGNLGDVKALTEALYQALKPHTKPRFDTVSKVLGALGMRISVHTRTI
jgi:putative component of toxin-antitoxin plasmid stabilization module